MDARKDTSAVDRKYMRRALGLGRFGIGRASPNPTVGCVVVRRGEIVGCGYHDYREHDHAEVRAVRAAGDRARGATAFVTLEPCSHHGRTPPCAELLIESGVRRVVVPLIDPNPEVSGKGISMLRSAGIRVDVGLMQEDAARLIEPFACYITTGRPLVVSKVGMSLDGRIATRCGAARWITSGKGREFGQDLRRELDAILVGSGTILTDDPRLSYRGKKQKGRPLLRVILDQRLRTPPTARIFQDVEDSPVLLFSGMNSSASRRRRLEARGAEVIPVPGVRYGLDLNAILEELASRKVLGLLVEGGSAVHWSFLSAGLVDKFYFIVAPVVLGGEKSVPCVGGEGFEDISNAVKFKVIHMRDAGCDLVIEAYPSFSRSLLSPWQPARNAPSSAPGPPLSSMLK